MIFNWGDASIPTLPYSTPAPTRTGTLSDP